uniref:Uncharacterized protein n=1 Tax=Lates calcarifer TaxID=8187 RepID=A0A4W6CHY5_LATCA
MVVRVLLLAVQVAHDDQLRQLLVRVHGDLQAEELVGVGPCAQRVLCHAVGAGVPVGGHGDGEEGADVRELRRVVVDVQHLDAAFDQPRPRADALHHVGDRHLKLQETSVALKQIAAVPQRLAVDGDLGGVDVAGLAVHPQVWGNPPPACRGDRCRAGPGRPPDSRSACWAAAPQERDTGCRWARRYRRPAGQPPTTEPPTSAPPCLHPTAPL